MVGIENAFSGNLLVPFSGMDSVPHLHMVFGRQDLDTSQVEFLAQIGWTDVYVYIFICILIYSFLI